MPPGRRGRYASGKTTASQNARPRTVFETSVGRDASVLVERDPNRGDWE
jgi:hypothetical protein